MIITELAELATNTESEYIIYDGVIFEFSPSKKYVRLGNEWIFCENVNVLENLT